MRAFNHVNREGEKINHWTVLKYSHTDKYRKAHYLCRCVCGHEAVRNLTNILYTINSKSCGCQNAKNHIVHGKSNERVYNIWQSMKNRCDNPNSTGYKWYGERGITICKRWYDFDNFFKDMGNPPSNKHSIDRKNNNGNYSPRNCRWATPKQQANNRRPRLPKPPKQ